jgi:uncharacterized protein
MTIAAYADSEFGPQETTVLVGDNLRTSLHRRPHTHRQISVYNAPQGGAYFMIRFFQLVISPQDGPRCRFKPCCSNYARQAVLKYGALLGALLAGDRLLRCNPYNPPGTDPVP